MTWSFSRLNSFDNGCKYCWFENYANNRKDSVQNAFAEYGILMHEILEGLDREEIMLWDALENFEKGFVKISSFPPNKWVNLRERYYEQGVKYLNNYRFNDNYETISVEEKVDVEISEYYFTGYIDKLIRDKSDGRLIVLDHKSKSNFKSKKELKEYARQLYLYSYAVKNRYGEYPKILLFNMFRVNKEVPIFFNESDLYEAIEWMHRVIDDIKDCEIFPVTDDNFFAKELCNFRHDEGHFKGSYKTLSDWTVGSWWEKVSG